MFEMVDPDCPKCGTKVRETVSEFFFSAEDSAAPENALARITGHKCGCGHKFTVVTYRTPEQKKASGSVDQK